MLGEKNEEKKKCDYKMLRGKSCGRVLYDDKHCIFHSKDIEGKKEKFDDVFWEEFKRQKEHEEMYNFKGFVFPGDISFEGEKIEKNAFFGHAQFLGVADFSYAEFSGMAEFMYAQFSGGANFACAFSRVALFEGAKFSEVANFGHVQLFTEANFRRSQFSGMAFFAGAQFSGMAFFGGAKFSGLAFFGGAKFSGTTDFNKAKFIEDADFKNITIKNNSSFKMIDTYFYNVSGLFEYIEENDEVFKRLRKISKTLKTEFLPKNFKLILGEGVTARYPVQSRQIKDDMYLLDKEKRISKLGPWRRRFGIKRILFFLWWLFANYGRSFKRWAAWSFGFAIAFAFIYYSFYTDYMLNFRTVYVSERFPLFSFIYYSIVTFTTLGFGDIVPGTDWLQFWVMLEVILGYIMLGGLISILANKLARRS